MSLAESTIPGFHAPLRLDRTGHGGGVAVWVKEDLAYEHLTMIDCGPHEVIWLSIKINSRKKLVIGAVYRPGSLSGHDISLLEYLDDQLDDIRKHGSHILMAGDFNVHSESWLSSTKTTPAGDYTEEICTAHGLQQHVKFATRGANRLDLVLSDLGNQVSVTSTNPIGNSDHITLLTTINTRPFREKRTVRQVWRYDRADWGRLRKFLKDADWNNIISDDPEAACAAVTATISEGMCQFIPSKKLVTRPSDPAWWTPECTTAVRDKQAAWKRFRKHPTKKNEELYKLSCSRSAACIRDAKARETVHLRQLLQNGSLSSKQWWSSVRRAGGDGRKTSIPVIRDNNGQEYSTAEEIATCFGRFFSKKCCLENGDFDSADLPAFPPRCTSSLHSVRFRPTTVRRLLRQLDPSKATGPDGVPSRVLKECAEPLALPLSDLFSLCFRCGTQPSTWKIANVVPVHKRKSKSEAKNYRPVSLLSIVSKVMEKIVNTSIMNYLEKGNLLSAHQFGFRTGLGAADLLTILNREWLTCLNSGGAVRVLAVDIAGAFDKVSHAGVLHKLSAYGITGNLHNWLTTYLQNRRLQVVVGGAHSQLFPIAAGVPQGSILGPTLFLVYVNDAADVLPNRVNPATYADDTTLFSTLSSAETATADCAAFQTGVDNLAHWGATWRVQFEPSKSQAMTISRHRSDWAIPPVTFNGLRVEEVDTMKLLGVTFDRHLYYGAHLRSTAIRAAQRIGFLRKAYRLLNHHGKTVVYKGFVRPVLEYCPLVWSGAADYHLARLDRIQRRALKLIGPGTIVDSLALRRTVSGLCLLFKLLSGPRVPTLQALLPSQLTNRENPRTRLQLAATHSFQLSLSLPARSNASTLRSFPYGSIAAWNSLPPSILDKAPDVTWFEKFKRSVYRHQLTSNWLWATDAL